MAEQEGADEREEEGADGREEVGEDGREEVAEEGADEREEEEEAAQGEGRGGELAVAPRESGSGFLIHGEWGRVLDWVNNRAIQPHTTRKTQICTQHIIISTDFWSHWRSLA